MLLDIVADESFDYCDKSLMLKWIKKQNKQTKEQITRGWVEPFIFLCIIFNSNQWFVKCISAWVLICICIQCAWMSCYSLFNCLLASQSWISLRIKLAYRRESWKWYFRFSLEYL